MRHGPRRQQWKLRRVWNKDARVIAVAKEAEVVDRPEPAASRGRPQMLHRAIPRGKGLSSGRLSTARDEETIEVPEDMLHAIAASAQCSLERDVPCEGRSDSGSEHVASSHRCTSAVGLMAARGSESATSRRS